MTTAKAFESRIIRELLSRRVHAQDCRGAGPGREPGREGGRGSGAKPASASDFEGNPGMSLLAERCIAVLAATAGLFLIGSVLQELLWALLAAGTVLTLGK